MSTTLPYWERFNWPDGYLWPNGGNGAWTYPGPDGQAGGSADVQGGRGAIHLTPNWVSRVPMFSSRLAIDDAPTFDLSFTIDTAEIAPIMTTQGASCYFYVQLETAATGVIQYELSYDYDYDEDEGVNHATPRLRARMNPNTGVGSNFNTGAAHTLTTLNTGAPVSVRILETGTSRSMKVWQGAEPGSWTVQGTAPAHTGARFIDLSVYSIQNSAASIYLDDIKVNAPIVLQPIPYLEPFNYTDGNPWPPATATGSGWISPGPNWSASCKSAVFGQRGAIYFGDGGAYEFNARLYTENAADYKLTFRLNIANLLPFIAGQPNANDPNFFLWVQLEDDVEGAVRYEIYLDPFDGFQVSILRRTAGPAGYLVWPYIKAAAGSPVTMSGLDLSQSLLVGIEEVGSSRRIKLWQDGQPEPSEWTATDDSAPIHSGPRYIDLYADARIDSGTPIVYIDDIGVNAGSTKAYIKAGETDHFVFWYENTLGARGLTDTTAAMAFAETDLLNHFGWFGDIWSNGPDKLDVKFGAEPVTDYLAYYAGYVEGVHFAWGAGDFTHIDTAYRGTFIHEVVHHFQTLQGREIIATESMCEAHAAFLERKWYGKVGDLDAIGSTNTYSAGVIDWLDSADRPDYVNWTMETQDPSNLFRLAVGCTFTFLHYLCTHRGYSPTAITRAGARSPRAIYRNLTGDAADPFQVFLDELDSAFPRGAWQQNITDPYGFAQWPSGDPANPYPFPGSAGTTVKGGGAGAAFVNGLPITAQALKHFFRRH